MVAIFRKSRVLVCCLFTLSLFFNNSFGLVHELNKKSITKFLRGKFFTLTFVDSPTCMRCRVLYPFFVAASQVFPHDPEIFFTRTHDPHLIQDWGVTELPALVYHRQDVTRPEFMKVDVTVDDVIDEIAKILHGNFGGLTRTYCLHVDEKIYDELIITPKQSVLVLLHDKNDEERFIMEKAAYAFRKDDAILFATLDVSKHRKLRDDRFLTHDTPAVMWMSAEDKKPKRYGGVISLEMLVLFVNERTGLNRDPDGAMQGMAGRITEADELIEENIGKILEGSAEDLKSIMTDLSALRETIDMHMHDMLDYYLYILDNIAMSGGAKVIKEMLKAVETKLFEPEEISTKSQEIFKRRKNVLAFFRQLEKSYSDQKKRQTKKDIQQKTEEKRVEAELKVKHSHMHTEL